MIKTPYLSDSVHEIPPALAKDVEEVVLFGSVADIGEVLARLQERDDVPDDVRYGLESLRYFREHYKAEVSHMSEAARRKVVEVDADWTMNLIQMLHPRAFDVKEDRLA